MPESDTFDFSCPACDCQLRVTAAMAGVKGPCPKCGEHITAPQDLAQKPGGQEPGQTPTHIPAEKIRNAAQLIRQSSRPEKSDPEPLPVVEPQPIKCRQIAPSEINTKAGIPNPPRSRKLSLLGVLIPCSSVAAVCLLSSFVLEFMGIIDFWQFQYPENRVFVQAPPPEAQRQAKATTEVGRAPIPGPTTQQEPSSFQGVRQDTQVSAKNAGQAAANEPAATEVVAQPAIQTSAQKAPALVPAPPKQAVTPTPARRTSPLIANISEQGEFPELKLSPFAPETGRENAENADPRPAPRVGYMPGKNLEAFLSAQTLKDRTPFILKEQRSTAGLAESSLQGPLKPVKSVRLLETRAGMDKDVTEHLYMVSFHDSTQDRERLNVVVLLVERTGTHPPLVHAKAFIEHYDKAMLTYAREPTTENASFHCIAEANVADGDSVLPEEMKKSMIRFSVKSHPYYPAHFDAYLSKQSPLMSHVGTGKNFPYTISKFCILSFRWNTSELGRPFIEVLDIINPGAWHSGSLSQNASVFHGGHSTGQGR